MGFIYSLASEVIVSLSGAAASVLKEMNESDGLTDNALSILEKEAWINSVWTYQEVVNSKTFSFVSNEVDNMVIDGTDFLNRTGYSLSLYTKEHSTDDFAISERFPGLDAFQDVIADREIAGYMDRSALQVMSNMDKRFASSAENYFYAMVGAITQDVSQSTAHPTIAELAISFMIICEKKNDYSFIYSSTPRDYTPGRRWRPQPGLLHSILPWHSWGEAQRAHYDSEGFWLDDALSLDISTHMGGPGREYIISWLKKPSIEESVDATIAEQLFERLPRMGFRGSYSYVTTTCGLFFPQELLPTGANIALIISASIRWSVGAPGLAKVGTGEAVSYIPGLFVGALPKDGVGSVLVDPTSPAQNLYI